MKCNSNNLNQRLSIASEGSSSVGQSGITLMDASEAGYTNGNIPFMPNIRLLDEFTGSQVENSIGDLNKLSLARMNAGVAYLKVTEPPLNGLTPIQFQGWLTNVKHSLLIIYRVVYFFS